MTRWPVAAVFLAACVAIGLLTLGPETGTAGAEEAYGSSPLAGIVRDAEGAPVAEVEVSFRRYGPGTWKWSEASIAARFDPEPATPVLARTTTDAQGGWRLAVPGVGLGGSLQFRAPDGRIARSVHTFAPPVAGAPIESTLLATRDVVVTVVDHEGKPLVARVGVRIARPSPTGLQAHDPAGFGLDLVTDAGGRVRVPTPPGAGLGVRVHVPGVGALQNVQVEPGRDALTIAIRRAKGPAVRGVVRDEAGKPVADARVVATLAGGTGPFATASAEAFATCDGEGRYVLEHLPGTYLASIAAWKHGYAIAAIPPTSNGGSMALPATGALPLDLVLTRGRTIRGVVVDERGAPVPGADVWLSEKLVGSEFSAIDHTPTVTDDQGRFELAGLRMDAGYVRARTDSRRLASYWQGPGPHGHRVARDMPATIEDVRLALAPGETVGGRLVDAAGAPVAGAAVRLSYVTGRTSVTGQEAVWSDAQGRFAFHGLPPIEYPSVRVDAPGFAPHEARLGREGGTDATIRVPRGGTIAGRVVNAQGEPVAGTSVRSNTNAASALTDAEGRFLLERQPPGRHEIVHGGPGGETGLARTVVQLAEGARVEDVELRLPGPTAAPGTESIAGQVVDEHGEPVAGERFEIQPIGRILHSRAGGTVITDDDGRFRIDGLVPGEYAVQPWPPVRRAPTVRAGTLDAVIEVRSRATYMVAGRVLDPSGAPIPHAVVESFHHGAGREVMHARTVLFGGRFRLAVRSAAPSHYLRVSQPRGHDGRPLNLIQGTQLEVSGPGEPLEIRLVEAATIRGVFQDDEGRPVQGVIVSTMAWPHPASQPVPEAAESDAEGRFAVTGLVPGTYQVSVRPPPGYEPPAAMQIKAPTPEATVHTLKPLAHIAGRLLGVDGRPIPKVRVYAQAQPREKGTTPSRAGRTRTALFADAFTDREGRFAIVGLSTDFVYDLGLNLPTEMRIHAFAPPLERIEPNGEDVAIRLTPAVTIAGRVLTPEGTPAAQVGVGCFGAPDDAGVRDPQLRASGMTDEQGRFEIGPLRTEGSVTVRAAVPPNRVSPERPWLPAMRAEVATGSRDVELTLAAGVEIRGRVEGVTPAQLQHVELIANDVNKRAVGRFRFDGSGTTFRIVGLAPGTYGLAFNRVPRGLRFHPIDPVTAPVHDLLLQKVVEFELKGRITRVKKPEQWTARFLQDGRSSRSQAVRVDSDGLFDLGRRPNRPGILYMTGPDESKVVWLEVTPDGTPVAAKPIKTKPLKGKILELPGKIRRGTVTARFETLRFQATISDDGYFTFEHLPPGPWTLSFRYSAPRGRIDAPEPVAPGNRLRFFRWSAER